MAKAPTPNLNAKLLAGPLSAGRYADGNSGLALKVDGQGRRYWTYRRQEGGHRLEKSLGPAERLTLQQARAAARRIAADAPSLAAAAADVGKDVPTFRQVAREAIALRAPTWRNPKSEAQWLSSLEAYAFNIMGDLPVNLIGRAEAHAVLAPIWTSHPETARRLKQRISVVLTTAVAQGHREADLPWPAVIAGLPRHKRGPAHFAALEAAEVPAFVVRLAGSTAGPVVRAAIEFALLTAARPGMVNGARWNEFDRVEGVWTVPAERMKAGRLHRVPLAPRALEILDLMASLRPVGCEHVFFGADLRGGLSGDAMRMALRRLGLDITAHGFRTSFKAWSLSGGWPDYLSEAALAHTDPNKARAAYARGDLLEERRPMMDAWAAYASGRDESAEDAVEAVVVPLRREQTAKGGRAA